MIEKNTKTTDQAAAPTNGPKLTPRAQQPKLVDAEPPLFLVTDLDLRRWTAEQTRADRKIDEAYKEHPPGKTLFVTATRTLPSRRRAGVGFSSQGRTEVKVIDATDAEVAQLQKSGQNVVNPVGAKEIADDTGEHGGLVVFEGPGVGTDEKAAAAEKSELEAENTRLRAELARASRAHVSAISDGRPERIGKDAPKV